MTGVTVDGKPVVGPVLVHDGLIDATIPAEVTTGAPVPVLVTTAAGSDSETYIVSAV